MMWGWPIAGLLARDLYLVLEFTCFWHQSDQVYLLLAKKTIEIYLVPGTSQIQDTRYYSTRYTQACGVRVVSWSMAAGLLVLWSRQFAHVQLVIMDLCPLHITFLFFLHEQAYRLIIGTPQPSSRYIFCLIYCIHLRRYRYQLRQQWNRLPTAIICTRAEPNSVLRTYQ